METDLHFRGTDYSQLEECHLKLVRRVRESSEALSGNSVIALKAKALNRHYYNQTDAFSPFVFEQKYQISPGEFPQGAKSNAVVNLFGRCNNSCGLEHLASIEWCTDNRLGIGANFLKHAFLKQRYESDRTRYLGIIVALDETLISAAGMSSAVASAKEYQIHYDEIYGPVIDAPLAIINLRA